MDHISAPDEVKYISEIIFNEAFWSVCGGSFKKTTATYIIFIPCNKCNCAIGLHQVAGHKRLQGGYCRKISEVFSAI